MFRGAITFLLVLSNLAYLVGAWVGSMCKDLFSL